MVSRGRFTLLEYPADFSVQPVGLILEGFADGPAICQIVVHLDPSLELGDQPAPLVPAHENTRAAGHRGFTEQVEQEGPHVVIGQLPPVLARVLQGQPKPGEARYTEGERRVWQAG